MSPLEQKRADYLFAFGHVLHYTAADVDRLTLDEFEGLCRNIDAYFAELKKARG